MTEPTNMNAQPESAPIRPPLWAMRALAAMGLAVSAYLAVTHTLALWGASEVTVPLCGGLRGLDCESVLNSRWSTWYGIPVAVGGVVAHAMMLVGLLAVASPNRRHETTWWLLRVIAGVVFGAALWFTFVQWKHLGAWCAWCMFDHAIGLMLAVLVLLFAEPGDGPMRRVSGWVVSSALLAVLIFGQELSSAGYTQPIAWQEAGERWVEPADDANRLVLVGGGAEVDRTAHPMLGRADAEHVVIEVIDFTCKRCAWFADVLAGALDHLGPEVAVMVVFSPTAADCNKHVQTTPAFAADACDYVRLAAAVWLADPPSYVSYHHWLLDHQQGMTVAKAREHAESLVGNRRLDAALGSGRVDRLIERDVELARWLKVRNLPGLVVGETVFAALPVEPMQLAGLIRQSLDRSP